MEKVKKNTDFIHISSSWNWEYIKERNNNYL